MKYSILIFVLHLSLASIGTAQTVLPIHAHNDYNNDKPFYGAINRIVKSIEADICLVNDTLYVAHEIETIRQDRTLQSLYLEPAKSLIEAGEWEYGGEQLILLIDIKTDATSTYRKLDEVLADYAEILTNYKRGKETKPGKISVVISGNRAFELIKHDSSGFAAIDGRWSEDDINADSDLYPMISYHWFRIIPLLKGKTEKDKFEYLKSRIEEIKQSGKLVRFWATPDNKKMWHMLRKLGVSIINTDNVDKLADYIEEGN